MHGWTLRRQFCAKKHQSEINHPVSHSHCTSLGPTGKRVAQGAEGAEIEIPKASRGRGRQGMFPFPADWGSAERR